MQCDRQFCLVGETDLRPPSNNQQVLIAPRALGRARMAASVDQECMLAIRQHYFSGVSLSLHRMFIVQ
jgi:hypothetical protein